MATDADIGYGTTWSINGTPVAEVIEVTPGETTADRVEATHMGSPGRRREYIAGLIDNGEASFTINWVPGNATDALIRTLMASGEVVEHIITFPNLVNVTFDGAIIG